MNVRIDLKQADFPGNGEALLYFVFEETWKEDTNLKTLDKVTKGSISKKLKKYDFQGKEGESTFVESDDYAAIYVIGLGKKEEFSLKKWKDTLPEFINKITALKIDSINIFYFPELGENYEEVGKILTLVANLSQYKFTKYKDKEEVKKINTIKSVQFNFKKGNKYYETIKKEFEKGIKIGEILSEAITLTRDMVNEPSSAMGTMEMTQIAKKIQREAKRKIELTVLDGKACEKLGMGAFLGVAQGSDREPQFIVLHYKPETKTTKDQKKFCLIGKSIVFDSGGLSIKPAHAMEEMKMDMTGGATVLGIFQILSQWDEKELGPFQYEVFGILPACENMISGRAMRPGDILTAMNGKTIEVLNTDAEGRLALADALSYAEEKIKPDYIIDLATLTGACLVALGEDIAGLMGNDEKLMSRLEELSKEQGDEMWRLPMYKPYLKQMKSDIADLNNLGSRYGGTITAALFLQEFVKNAKWVHFDIAGPAHSSSVKGLTPKGGTGWGVMTLIELLRRGVE